MAKSKNESNNKSSGTLLTEKDGTRYFVMGKVRIKASEQMCIRDSRNGVGKRLLGRTAAGSILTYLIYGRNRMNDKKRLNSYEAVSYTHL